MKRVNIVRWGILMCASLFFSSCGEDRYHEYEELSSTNQWIYKTLKEHYLWNEEMPKEEHLHFVGPSAEDFFKSCLVDADGYTSSSGEKVPFSTLTSLKGHPVTRSIHDASNSYGMEFMIIAVPNSKSYILQVLYTIKGSPAEEAGLKRGYYITQIDNALISQSNIDKFDAGPKHTLTYRTSLNSNEDKTIELPASRAIDNNPVYFHSTIQNRSKKIGYLVYNQFEKGKSNKSDEYDNDLKNVVKGFKQEGVDELILDLRYNNGGLVSSAILLGSMLAPKACVEGETKLMTTLQYNKTSARKPTELHFLNDHQVPNLNLKRLYVLTTGATASASELVINCLRPYMDVIIVGKKTLGKNVGSEPYTDNNKEWEMYPIVCKIYNSNQESDYATGFKPNIEVSDDEMLDIYPFGSEKDPFIKKAIDHINGVVASPTTENNANVNDNNTSTRSVKNSYIFRFFSPYVYKGGVVIDL